MSVPFWATIFERFPLREVGASKRFVNADGTPVDAFIGRRESDGAMLLDESGDGFPADVEVIIEYSDDNGKEFKESVSLNPYLWVSMTFSSKERHSSSVMYDTDD